MFSYLQFFHKATLYNRHIVDSTQISSYTNVRKYFNLYESVKEIDSVLKEISNSMEIVTNSINKSNSNFEAASSAIEEITSSI